MISNRFPGLAVDDLPADLPAILDVLADTHPAIALALVRALDETGTPALHATANRLLETLANDSRLDQEVDAVVCRACTAQETFENWADERIDVVLLDVAKAFADSAKELVALKARNAVILSFHHQAQGVGQRTVGIVRDVLKAHGAPVDLVQCVRRRGRKATRRFMSHPRVALATGGRKMVEAAYSSGTPAIGVGPGNAPAWICADADLDRAAGAIVASKTFDNGLICGAEHNLVVDSRVVVPFAAALIAHGAAILTPDEERRFTAGAVDALGRLRREFVGQSAKTIAAALDIVRPYALRLLVAQTAFSASDRFYSGEKLAPFLSMFTVAGEDEGLRLCQTLLKITGAGHTAVIHSTNAARVERFARAMPAGRILVNSSAAQGCCGMTTGLDCSLTLGCGTFGGNSTTDNVTFRHLLNIKRVACPLDRPAHQEKISA